MRKHLFKKEKSRRSEQLSAGFTLIELLIAMGILLSISSAILLFSKTALQTQQLTSTTLSAHHLLHLAKFHAIATQSDTDYHIQNNTLTVINTTTEFPIPIDSAISTKINGKEKLGIKANGNTKYAGTLTLNTSTTEHRITLGVGNSVPKFYIETP